MIFPALLFILILFSLVLQDFIPIIPWAYQSTLNLVSVTFFACAISIPFPVMLLLAFFTGFVFDAKNLNLAPDLDVVEAANSLGIALPESGATFGFSIFLFALFGSLMQGIRPLFRKGRWELPVFMCGVGTFLILLFEYLWINFRRGGFYFPMEIWNYILTTALLSTLVAPFAFFFIHKLAKLCGYHIRYEGLAYRRWS
ncbi:MAG: hypothetical protein KA004_11440 [Verrucomicrobiales bacterium]|nr:hypothetical protein [Verrucomicrobiales bacterium]